MLSIIIPHRVQIRPERSGDANGHPKKISLRPCYRFWVGLEKNTNSEHCRGGERGGVMSKLHVNSEKGLNSLMNFCLHYSFVCEKATRAALAAHLRTKRKRDSLQSEHKISCSLVPRRRLYYQSAEHMVSEVLGLLPGSFCPELACSPLILHISQCPPTSS